MQQNLKDTAQALLEAQHIAIISHKNPDGDTLGSQLALGRALQQTGKIISSVYCTTVSAPAIK